MDVIDNISNINNKTYCSIFSLIIELCNQIICIINK